MTAAKLKTRTVKDLAAMARKKKVVGWHVMRKDELIGALLKSAATEVAKQNGKANGAGNGTANGRSKLLVKPQPAHHGAAHNGATHRGASPNGAAVSHTGVSAARVLPAVTTQRSPRLVRRLEQIKSKLASAKDLAIHALADGNGHVKDRLVVMVRDPYWLHVYWELSRRGIDRARAAMGQHWHEARPVLRLHEVSRNGTTSSARQPVRDIEIHGGVSNWYIDVQDPPKSYQVEIGYLASGNRFYCLARSNVVSTPKGGSTEAFDKNWAEVAKDFDRIYAMSGGYVDQESHGELKEVFEEQLHRPMGDPMVTQFGRGAGAFGGHHQEFNFQVETELIVHGVAHPDARVTLRGEPVHLRPDGTFAVRFNLPDRRHVLPVVASSSDGVEQRTIVLAVDRNTKVMEPILREPGG
jgi:hypothetical protein